MCELLRFYFYFLGFLYLHKTQFVKWYIFNCLAKDFFDENQQMRSQKQNRIESFLWEFFFTYKWMNG
jgi:hypothetical protein